MLVHPSPEIVKAKTLIPPTVGGIDFGFHNPFAAVAGHLDHDDVLWIYWVRYKNECTMPVHSEALPLRVQWWADPSGAESIAALRQAGHDVKPCVHMPTRGSTGEKKSPKLSGIDMVSERMRTGRLKIVRCPETMPLIRELGMYRYDPEKKLEEPIDEDNHACDALRYLVVGLDRGRRVPSVRPIMTDQERAELEAKDRQEAFEAAQARDAAAQRDAEDDRWWQ